MTSDEDNNSIQQSLPLSWEDSEGQSEEQPPVKKLLLKRSEDISTPELPEEFNEDDEVSSDFQNDHQPVEQCCGSNR